MMARRTLLAAARRRNSGFDPSQYGVVKLWLSARKETAYSDGAAVPSQTDFGPGAKHATQGTSTRRPTYRTAVLGSKLLPAFRYDGSNDCTVTPAISLDTSVGFTFFVVGRFTTGAPLFVEQNSYAVATPGFYFYGTSGQSWQVYSGAGYRYISVSSGWFGSVAASAAVAYRQATARVFKNGSAVAGPALGVVNSPADAVITGPINVGSRNQAALFTSGDLGDLMLWEGELSGASILEIHTAMTTIYGL